MNDPKNLLRNPRKIVPPSQRIGLDKWRKLPVEGQGVPLYTRTVKSDLLLVCFGLGVLIYFATRGLW